MAWQLNKFDPSKTIYFKGFNAINCPAVAHDASPSGFTLSQKFTSDEDFSDLVIWDAYDYFKEPAWLPDGNLSGVILQFDVTADQTVFATLDSIRFPSIDFPFLDCIRMDGTVTRIDLSWANIQTTVNSALKTNPPTTIPVIPNNNPTTVVAGAHTTASATFTVDSSGGTAGQYLTLWYENFAFQYLMFGADSDSYIASQMVAGINASGANITATWGGGASFDVYAQYPGVEGDNIALYWTNSAGGGTGPVFTQTNPIQLTGGNSDVTFRCTIDFSALGISNLRQAILTFAPQKPYGQNLNTSVGVAGDCVFSSWNVTDPYGNTKLYVRGEGSVRVEESSSWVVPTGKWAINTDGFFSKGFSLKSSNSGDVLDCRYFCDSVHDLYIGTWLYANGASVSVSIDGAAEFVVSLAIPNFSSGDAPIAGEVLLMSNIASGAHTVQITVVGGECYFDYLDAVVPVRDVVPQGPYYNRGVSTDLDTEHGYQQPPARLASGIEYLGLYGDVDHYVGVFWWNNRALAGRVLGFVQIDFSTFSVTEGLNSGIFLDLSGVIMGKSYIFGEPYDATIAALHFALYVNELFAGVYATASGSILTITARASSQSNPAYGFTFSAEWTDDGVVFFPITFSGSFIYGVGSPIADGTYYIDPSQAAINYPMGLWLLDYFRNLKTLGIGVASAFSMELVNPPDQNVVGDVWVQRSNNAFPIETDTGFGSYISSQCAPMATSFLNFQKAAYLQLATIMQTAGVRPYIQFGEFLWWFFSSLWQVPIGNVAILSYVRLGFADPPGLAIGDPIKVANCLSIPSINGNWTVVATPDATHVDITAPYSGGTWDGDGIATGGSMAYYDAETSQAALAALGRPLATFVYPTDDPNVNGGADAGFLAARLSQHVREIATYVDAAIGGLLSEILWPADVNGPVPYPISNVGGPMNHYVNLPIDWKSSASAPFTIWKTEQLAAMTTDRNCELVKQGLIFVTTTIDWPIGLQRYLYPVDGPSIAQWREYRLAADYQFPNLNPFAIDQICLYDWDIIPPGDPTVQSN